MSKIDELRAAYPDYAEWLYSDYDGNVYIDACEVYNGREDLGGYDEAVPDGTESVEQKNLAALVDYVNECRDCAACGNW